MWTTNSKGPFAVEQAFRQYLPPCQLQCRIHEDIQRTNVLIANVGEGKLTLERIRNEGYKAVFVAKEIPTPRTLTYGHEKVVGQGLSGGMCLLAHPTDVSR